MGILLPVGILTVAVSSGSHLVLALPELDSFLPPRKVLVPPSSKLSLWTDHQQLGAFSLGPNFLRLFSLCSL